MSECVATFERNQPVLKALSERYQLGIVSNFYGNLEAVCEGAGLCPFFKVMVDSHCVGAEKPDPVIFRAALERLGATPEKTVFIGDSLRRDREGARRMAVPPENCSNGFGQIGALSKIMRARVWPGTVATDVNSGPLSLFVCITRQ